MQHRHFLVHGEEGDYKLREIDSVIAKGISLFGIITGKSYTIESEQWVFYFMNFHISEERADAIAQELMHDLQSSNPRNRHSA